MTPAEFDEERVDEEISNGEPDREPATGARRLDEALDIEELAPFSGSEPDPIPDPVQEPPPETEPPEDEPPSSEEQPAVPDAEPEKQRRIRLPGGETTRRVLWAVPWVIFAIAIVAIGGAAFALPILVLGIIGLREFFAMTERARPFAMPAYLTLAGMVAAAYFGGTYQVLLAAACCFPLSFLWAIRRDERRNVTYSIAITLLGTLWIGLGFSHAVLLRELPLHGGALLIDVLVATFAGDTAAYAAGRLFGSRKITPRISPNKTFEGLIGGFVGATLGFWLAGLYQDWLPGIDALVMGMCVAAIAPIGDLFASMVKRDCDVKDTGRLFGPHGGLIDRLDAALFTIVIGYYLSVAFVY